MGAVQQRPPARRAEQGARDVGVLLPPEHLDRQALLAMGAEQFGVSHADVHFSPLGEDSWCFRIGDLWVSARRDLRGHVTGAYEAAHLLCSAGLEFVLAPLPGADGRLVHEVGGYPVVVFPFLEVAQATDPSPSEVGEIVRMLARVHSTGLRPPVPTETFELSFDSDLDLALAIAEGEAPGSGPFAQRLQRLLWRHREYVQGLRDEYAALRVDCSADTELLVLTHGEPILSNVLRHDGRLLLADWGDAAWGPRERDWSHVVRDAGASLPCRPEFLRLYQVKWILSEIAEYVAALGEPHIGHADDEAMWARLVAYLPQAAEGRPA
jgi:spectinomycin phosphotransferase